MAFSGLLMYLYLIKGNTDTPPNYDIQVIPSNTRSQGSLSHSAETFKGSFIFRRTRVMVWEFLLGRSVPTLPVSSSLIALSKILSMLRLCYSLWYYPEEGSGLMLWLLSIFRTSVHTCLCDTGGFASQTQGLYQNLKSQRILLTL